MSGGANVFNNDEKVTVNPLPAGDVVESPVTLEQQRARLVSVQTMRRRSLDSLDRIPTPPSLLPRERRHSASDDARLTPWDRTEIIRIAQHYIGKQLNAQQRSEWQTTYTPLRKKAIVEGSLYYALMVHLNDRKRPQPLPKISPYAGEITMEIAMERSGTAVAIPWLYYFVNQTLAILSFRLQEVEATLKDWLGPISLSEITQRVEQGVSADFLPPSKSLSLKTQQAIQAAIGTLPAGRVFSGNQSSIAAGSADANALQGRGRAYSDPIGSGRASYELSKNVITVWGDELAAFGEDKTQREAFITSVVEKFTHNGEAWRTLRAAPDGLSTAIATQLFLHLKKKSPVSYFGEYKAAFENWPQRDAVVEEIATAMSKAFLMASSDTASANTVEAMGQQGDESKGSLRPPLPSNRRAVVSALAPEQTQLESLTPKTPAQGALGNAQSNPAFKARPRSQSEGSGLPTLPRIDPWELAKNKGLRQSPVGRSAVVESTDGEFSQNLGLRQRSQSPSIAAGAAAIESTVANVFGPNSRLLPAIRISDNTSVSPVSTPGAGEYAMAFSPMSQLGSPTANAVQSPVPEGTHG